MPMMGINGPGRRINEEELRRLWSDPATGADLRRIGVEVPSQLGALFLMDGEEIDRITREVAPLRDNYPKRLSDAAWDTQANFDFAAASMEPASVSERFVGSPLIKRIWPEALSSSMESLFAVRETRYLSETVGSNKLAELDLFLRGTRLRMLCSVRYRAIPSARLFFGRLFLFCGTDWPIAGTELCFFQHAASLRRSRDLDHHGDHGSCGDARHGAPQSNRNINALRSRRKLLFDADSRRRSGRR